MSCSFASFWFPVFIVSSIFLRNDLSLVRLALLTSVFRAIFRVAFFADLVLGILVPLVIFLIFMYFCFYCQVFIYR